MNISILIALSILCGILLYAINKKLLDNYIDNNTYICIISAFLIFMSVTFLYIKKYTLIFSAIDLMIIFNMILLSIWDIKEKKIPQPFVAILFVLSIILCIAGGGSVIINNIISFVFFLIMMSILYFGSKKKIGFGDVEIIVALAMALGYPNIFAMLIMSLFIALVYAVVLITKKKKDKKYEIPLIPFLLIGLVLNYLIY